MPCHVDISASEEANHFQILLCKACKFLSPKQIDSLINPGSGIFDGLDWYKGHLMCDYSHRCFKDDVLDFDLETNEFEKQEILRELNRVGYDLVIKEHSIELISLT